MITQFKRDNKTTVESRPGLPGPSNRTKRTVVREVLRDPRKSLGELAATSQKSKRTIQQYLHSMSMYKRIATVRQCGSGTTKILPPKTAFFTTD